MRWFWKMLRKLIQYFLKRFSELVCLLSSPSASAQLTLNSEFPVISWLMWVERPPKIHEICFVTSRIHRYIRSKAKRDLFFPWICLGLVLEIHFPSLQPSRDGNRFEPGGAQAQVVKPEQWSYIVGAGQPRQLIVGPLSCQDSQVCWQTCFEHLRKSESVPQCGCSAFSTSSMCFASPSCLSSWTLACRLTFERLSWLST